MSKAHYLEDAAAALGHQHPYRKPTQITVPFGATMATRTKSIEGYA